MNAELKLAPHMIDALNELNSETSLTLILMFNSKIKTKPRTIREKRERERGKERPNTRRRKKKNENNCECVCFVSIFHEEEKNTSLTTSKLNRHVREYNAHPKPIYAHNNKP